MLCCVDVCIRWREPGPAPLLMNWSQISLAARPRFSLWHGSKREVVSGGQTMGQPQCSDQRQMLQGFYLKKACCICTAAKVPPRDRRRVSGITKLIFTGKAFSPMSYCSRHPEYKHTHIAAACMRIKCGRCT